MKAKFFFILLFFTVNSFAQFSFVHITDLHVSSVTSSVNACDLNGTMAHCYLKEFALQSPKPDFVIATGDISNIGNSNPAMYNVLTQFLFPPAITNPLPGAYFIDSTQTIPIYFTPGNHDYYTTLYPPGSLTQLNYVNNYAQNIAPDTDYAVTTTISVILFLRSGYDIPYWNQPDPISPASSGITLAQCNWIRNELSLNSGKRKIIVMHHPPVNLAGINCDGTPYTTEAILNAAAGSMSNYRTMFLNICDSNQVDIVLAGHQHQNVVADRAGHVINENCTTCGTRYVQTGAAFNGCYRTITVGSSFVTVSTPMQSCHSVASVNELNNSSDIDVFPSPSNGHFTIQINNKQLTDNYQLLVYNELGSKIYQSEIHNPKTEFDISSQPNGIYFMRVQTEQGIAVKKISIMK